MAILILFVMAALRAKAIFRPIDANALNYIMPRMPRMVQHQERSYILRQELLSQRLLRFCTSSRANLPTSKQRLLLSSSLGTFGNACTSQEFFKIYFYLNLIIITPILVYQEASDSPNAASSCWGVKRKLSLKSHSFETEEQSTQLAQPTPT